MANILVVGNFPTTSLTGHQVKTASGYDEAIELVNTNHFDVIIMDAVIGTTAGHETLKRFRDHHPVPTILRYRTPTITITDINKDWNVLPSVAACFPHVHPTKTGPGEWMRIKSLVKQLTHQPAH